MTLTRTASTSAQALAMELGITDTAKKAKVFDLILALLTLERERAWNAGYLAGFMASGEGWNGEHPFEFRGPPEDDAGWIERRDEIRRGEE